MSKRNPKPRNTRVLEENAGHENATFYPQYEVKFLGLSFWRFMVGLSLSGCNVPSFSSYEECSRWIDKQEAARLRGVVAHDRPSADLDDKPAPLTAEQTQSAVTLIKEQYLPTQEQVKEGRLVEAFDRARRKACEREQHHAALATQLTPGFFYEVIYGFNNESSEPSVIEKLNRAEMVKIAVLVAGASSISHEEAQDPDKRPAAFAQAQQQAVERFHEIALHIDSVPLKHFIACAGLQKEFQENERIAIEVKAKNVSLTSGPNT